MKRGEIWRIELDPTRGDEIQKTRPAVIVSDESDFLAIKKAIAFVFDLELPNEE